MSLVPPLIILGLSNLIVAHWSSLVLLNVVSLIIYKESIEFRVNVVIKFANFIFVSLVHFIFRILKLFRNPARGFTFWTFVILRFLSKLVLIMILFSHLILTIINPQFLLQFSLIILRLIIENFLIFSAWCFHFIFDAHWKLSMVEWQVRIFGRSWSARFYVVISAILIRSHVFESPDEKTVFPRLQEKPENHCDHWGGTRIRVVLFVILAGLFKFIYDNNLFLLCQGFDKTIILNLWHDFFENFDLGFKFWPWVFIFWRKCLRVEILKLLFRKRAAHYVLGWFDWNDFNFFVT